MMRARRSRHVWTVVALLLASTAGQAQILNSERIEQSFGSYGIDVMAADRGLRLSNLHSIEGERKVMRTYAIVATPARVDAAIAEPHADIIAGGSIGATFRADGWDVLKHHLFFGRARIPLAISEAMGIEPGDRPAMHVYRLDVAKADQHFEYATIIELHHPAYLELTDLIAIYAPDWRSDQALPRGISEMLIDAERLLEAESVP